MAIAESRAADFEMGRAARRTFEVIGQNIVTFGILSLLAGVPLAVMSWGGAQFGPYPARLLNPSALGFYAVTGVIYIIGALMLQAGVVEGTVATLRGKSASLENCLSVGLRSFLPLLLLGLAVTFGVAGGILLLIVPGIIFALMWSVAVPAFVVERKSVGESLSRSQALTRGHRWAILGLLVIFAILNLLLGMVAGVLGGLGFSLAAAAQGESLGFTAVTTIAQMIEAVIGASLVASIYYELRVAKEGIGPEALASVFD